MKNRALLLFFTFLSAFVQFQVSYAQEQEKDEVMKTVRQLFTAMETNDSSLAASLFTKDAQLYTVLKNENGISQLRNNPSTRLISAFGSKKSETWREPIWNEKIEIADGLASVWVDYAFYIGKKFSHCGTDAFHLIKIGSKWKIFHLADTRRKDNCEIPIDIQNKFKE